MDLETMRLRTKGYLGGRSDADQTIVDEYLNNAYREISTSFFFDTLETTDTTVTTVSGTAGYAIPSDLYTPVSVRDVTNERDLDSKEIEWYDEQDTDDNDGEPSAFVVYGTQMLLFPTPDDAYELKMRGPALPTALTANDDEPVLPIDWHPIIVLHAAADLAFYFAMDARGMMLRNEELSKIGTRTEKRTLRRRKQFGQISPRSRG